MYTLKDLDNEIAEKVVWLEENNGAELHKDWLIQAVLKDHTAVHGDDSDMAICCMRDTVSNKVRAYFNKIKASADLDPQMLLPGFKHLQKRYSIERKKQRVIVEIHNMTFDELTEKADEYYAMSKGAAEHGDEIIRYRDAISQAV